MTETEAVEAIIKVCREIQVLLREIKRKLDRTHRTLRKAGKVD